MRHKFNCQWSETVSFFNELFKEDLVAGGLERGISREALAARYQEYIREVSGTYSEIPETEPTLSGQFELELEKVARWIERALQTTDHGQSAPGETLDHFTKINLLETVRVELVKTLEMRLEDKESKTLGWAEMEAIVDVFKPYYRGGTTLCL